MSTLIAGLIGTTIITLFAGGLAISIGALPFYFIVGIVLVMVYVDFAQALIEEYKKNGQ